MNVEDSCSTTQSFLFFSVLFCILRNAFACIFFFFFLNYLGNRHTGKKEMKHKNNEQAIGSNTKLRAVSKDVSEERVCGVCCLCSSFS